jgi:thioredoxin
MNVHVLVEKVKDKNFQKQVLESTLPVIVVFEKSCWGTAQIIKPIIEKIATEYSGKIKVLRYNIEENPVNWEYYRIEDVTTILVFNKGSVIYKTGVISIDEFRKIINPLLSKNINPQSNKL